MPQGSVLGPTLWNILYDGVLRIDTPTDTALIAYADDLAAVVTDKSERDLVQVQKSNEIIARINDCMTEHSVQNSELYIHGFSYLSSKIVRKFMKSVIYRVI